MPVPSQAVQRKLIAILSADVKGYTRLMGEDEDATVRTLTAYRGVMTTHIQEHRGRVVDSPGDNLLAEFSSIVDAVQCAVEMQKDLKARNARLPLNRRMEFRIGINLGDVIVEGERIYGDGVNIAARLESLAEEGGICISGTVHDSVKNKLALGYESLGGHRVKNIAEPVRVYRILVESEAGPQKKGRPKRIRPRHWWKAALAAGGGLVLLGMGIMLWNSYFHPIPLSTVVPREKAQMLELPAKPSIAILPFVNMTRDPKQEYFSDGFTEDLITDLSKVSGLFIIARNSTFKYKGKAVRPEKVGRELGVRYVLEGSVRRAADRIRITAQLVDTTTGYHVWAERYDRNWKDIFVLQDEVTQEIARALAVKLTEAEQRTVLRKETDNLEAFDSYLLGRTYLLSFTKEGIVQARWIFERAIALDPKYAAAYTDLGLTYLTEWVWQWSEDPQSLERAFELAEKAIAIDDSLPMAHILMGRVYLWKMLHEQAIAHLERAIALDPNDARAYVHLANVLNYAGRPVEAIGLVKKAMRLDPFNSDRYLWALGHAYLMSRQYEDAIEALKRTLKHNPDLLPPHILLAIIYSELNREDEARAEVAEILRINPNFSLKAWSRGRTLRSGVRYTRKKLPLALHRGGVERDS
jgi:adenylate cyclase